MGYLGERGLNTPIVRPPKASNWTEKHDTSFSTPTVTLSDISQGISLSSTATADTNRTMALLSGGGSGTWSVTAGFTIDHQFDSFESSEYNFSTGICALKNSTNEGVAFGLETRGASTPVISAEYFPVLYGVSNSTSVFSDTTSNFISGGTTIHWLRMTQDTSNIIFWESGDGRNFEQRATLTKTTPFSAPDRLGIIIQTRTYPLSIRLFHWVTS